MGLRRERVPTDQALGERAAPTRQEALEEEVVHGQARRDEGAGHGRWSRDDLHPQAGVEHGVDEPLPRVGDPRHASVRDEGHMLARGDALDGALDTARQDVLVRTLQRDVQAKVREQAARHARVLAQDEVGGAQHLDHARRCVRDALERYFACLVGLKYGLCEWRGCELAF